MDSTFADRLNSNYAPNDIEIEQIKALIVQPLQEVAYIDEEIARLQALISQLTAKRHVFSAYIEAHQALVSPTRQVPRDVLEEIFVACLPTSRNAVMSSAEAPVLLGRVCRAWRSIAYSSPRLWASIHVPALTALIGASGTAMKYRQTLAQRHEAIEAWLKRSGDCPLSISLFVPGGVEEHALDDLMDLLLSVSSRWLWIRLQLPAPDFQRLRTISSSDVQILQRIELSVAPFTGGVNDSEQHSFDFLAAPSIRSAILCLDRLIPSAMLPIPWNKLTELSLVANNNSFGATSLQTADAMHVLSRCPNLQTCCLVISRPWNDNTSPFPTSTPQSITLTFLDSFTLWEMDGRDMVMFFDHLELPRLRSFRYRYRHSNPFAPESCASFASFLTRSPSLECLDSDVTPFPSIISFVTNLRHLVSLKHLRLRDNGALGHQNLPIDDDLLAQLTPSASGCLCPALTNIAFECSGALSDGGLLRFIEARAAWTHAGIEHLERIHVEFHRHADEDILPRLERLVSAGLRVSLSYAPLTQGPWAQPWASPLDGLDVFEDGSNIVEF